MKLIGTRWLYKNHGNNLIATDGAILIISDSATLGEHENSKGFPQTWENVLPAELNGNGYFKTSELDKIIANIPKSNYKEYSECPKCEGIGNYECRCCGQDVDCEKCEGNGNIPSGVMGLCIERQSVFVDICDKLFDAHYLEIINELAKGYDEIALIFIDESKIYLRIGKTLVLFMKCREGKPSYYLPLYQSRHAS